MSKIKLLKIQVLSTQYPFNQIKQIAGCDISFDKNDDTNAVASMVIFEYPFQPEPKILAKFSIRCQTNINFLLNY